MPPDGSSMKMPDLPSLSWAAWLPANCLLNEGESLNEYAILCIQLGLTQPDRQAN